MVIAYSLLEKEVAELERGLAVLRRATQTEASPQMKKLVIETISRNLASAARLTLDTIDNSTISAQTISDGTISGLYDRCEKIKLALNNYTDYINT